MHSSRQHHVTVNVSTARFARNIRFIKRNIAGARLCVVMKSEAYGHGLERLAPVAAEAGADYIGICTNPEAHSIRRLLPDIPVLRLRSALPAEYDESVDALAIDEQVGSLEVASYLGRLGRRRGRPVRVHLKVDTGMGRSGFLPGAIEAIRTTCGLPGLEVVGIMTHLASADDTALDRARQQLETFDRLREVLADCLPADILVHSHNSAATVRLPDQRADLVRVGAACYGVRTSTAFENPAGLKPVMSIRTQVMEVRRVPAGTCIGYGSLFRTERDSLIASVPVGFGEGYPRSLFNKGIVLIRGRRCPVIGRVSLNITTIDVTDLEQDIGHEIGWGEDVVLVGEQGDDAITFEELADRFDSVHTELNLMAGHMNERSYRD